MEMMDIRAAIRWLNESSDSMTVIVKSLESQPKGETDSLKRELIAAHRAAVEATLNNSIIAARLIGEQVLLELSLLMGHSEDYLALVKAQSRYREESNKACSVLKNTAPVNQTAPAAPPDLESRTPADRMKELMAKSSPIAASPAVTASTADDSASSMPSEAPVGAAHIIVEGNDNQTAERSD
jgi:cellobiose-specific phosphotransferase system component IIA